MSRTAERIEEMLEERGPDKTLCPSEVARDLASDAGNWRDEMAQVHEAVDALLAADRIALSWKGSALPARAGPYRIGQAPR